MRKMLLVDHSSSGHHERYRAALQRLSVVETTLVPFRFQPFRGWPVSYLRQRREYRDRVSGIIDGHRHGGIHILDIGNFFILGRKGKVPT